MAAEKYIKNNKWIVSCPIYLEGVFIRNTLDENNQIKEKRAAFAITNISMKTILAYKGYLKLSDSFKRPLENYEIVFNELSNFLSGTSLGEDTWYLIPPSSTFIDLVITAVTFVDGSVWEMNEEVYVNFEPTEENTFTAVTRVVANLELNYTHPITSIYHDGKTYFKCICGSINLPENSSCHSCSLNKDVMLRLSDPGYCVKYLDDSVQKLCTDDIRKLSMYSQYDVDSLVSNKLFGFKREKILELINRYEGINDVLLQYINKECGFDILLLLNKFRLAEMKYDKESYRKDILIVLVIIVIVFILSEIIKL